jgi:hypothetical protein
MTQQNSTRRAVMLDHRRADQLARVPGRFTPSYPVMNGGTARKARLQAMRRDPYILFSGEVGRKVRYFLCLHMHPTKGWRDEPMPHAEAGE